jgi:hypothetical protein
MVIESNWRITWNPSGESPVVLLDYGDEMEAEISGELAALVDISRYDTAPNGRPYGRGNRKRRLEFTRYRYYANPIAAFQAMLAANAADPWKEKQLLRIEPLLGSTYGRAAVLSVTREPVTDRPGFLEKWALRWNRGLTLTGDPFTVIGGWFNDPIVGGGTSSGSITIILDDDDHGLTEGNVVYLSGVTGVRPGYYPVTGVSGRNVTIGAETNNAPRLIVAGVTGGSEAGTVELEFDGTLYLDGMTGGGTYEVLKPGDVAWTEVIPDAFGRQTVPLSPPNSLITYGNPPLGLTNSWQGAENGDVLELDGQQHANPSGGVNPVDESGPTGWTAKLRHNGIQVDEQTIQPSWATAKTWQDSGPADHILASGKTAIFTLHAPGAGTTRRDTGVSNTITGGTIQKTE